MLTSLALSYLGAYGYIKFKGLWGPDASNDAAVVPARVYSKLQLRLLPLLLATVFLCYLDRTSLAFGSVQFKADLGFGPEVYGLGSGWFFLGYSMFMIPSNLLMLKVGTSAWLSFIMVAWGALAMAMSLVRVKYQFYLVRFLLGVAESGAFPGVWYYLSCFFPSDAISVPFSLIEGSVGFANVLAAPLAAVLLPLDGFQGLKGWQWLFILEGIPSVALGTAMYYMLPKDINSAHVLTVGEKRWLSQKLAQNLKAQSVAVNLTSKDLIILAAQNKHIWYVGTIGFLKSSAAQGLLFWIPSIVDFIVKPALRDLSFDPKYHASIVAAITAGPFFLTGLGAVVVGYLSQKGGARHAYLAVPYAAAAFVMFLLPRFVKASVAAGIAAMSLILVCVLAPNGILNALAAEAGEGAGLSMSLALYNAYSNLGGIVGPTLIGYTVKSNSNQSEAVKSLAIQMALASVLAWLLRSFPIDKKEGDKDKVKPRLEAAI